MVVQEGRRSMLCSAPSRFHNRNSLTIKCGGGSPVVLVAMCVPTKISPAPCVTFSERVKHRMNDKDWWMTCGRYLFCGRCKCNELTLACKIIRRLSFSLFECSGGFLRDDIWHVRVEGFLYCDVIAHYLYGLFLNHFIVSTCK